MTKKYCDLCEQEVDHDYRADKVEHLNHSVLLEIVFKRYDPPAEELDLCSACKAALCLRVAESLWGRAIDCSKNSGSHS